MDILTPIAKDITVIHDIDSLRLIRRIDAAYKAWHTADLYNSNWAKNFWNTVICDLMAEWRRLNPTKVN